MRNLSTIEILREIGITVNIETAKVIKILEKKDFDNENDIADKLEWRINDARKILYNLLNIGIVSYHKEKDPEKRWWYIYNWQLEKFKIHNKYIKYLEEKLHEKERKLIKEETLAFVCKKCKKKYSYSSAMHNGFSCEECGGVVQEIKNQTVIRKLSLEIAELLGKIKKEKESANENRKKEAKIKSELEEKEKKAKKSKSKKKPKKPKKSKGKSKKTKPKKRKKKKKKPKKKTLKKKRKKTPLMKKYEKKTGRKSIWLSKQTEGYVKWKKERRKK